MADIIDSVGIHRVIYQATSFGEGVNVTAFVYNPDLEKSNELVFVEIGDGFYYLNYSFISVGVYTMVMLENGVKKKSGTYRIISSPGIIKYIKRA